MHLAGSSAFTCGDINPHQGVQLMEAFKYALDDINSHKGIFKGILTGVTLGGLSLDACESATRAGNLLANLHSGYQSLATPSGRIDPANIAAYVGAMDSDTSKQMARVLNVVRVPQIRYDIPTVLYHAQQLGVLKKSNNKKLDWPHPPIPLLKTN